MTLKPLTLIVCFARGALTASDPADAGSKRHKRAVKHPAAGPAQPIPGYRHEPARMIEVRPGYWISTWGCFTDEGYGRIAGCEGRDSAD